MCGLPGTGKSHTVRTAIRALKQQQQQQGGAAGEAGGVGVAAAFVSCFAQDQAGRVHAAVLDQVAAETGAWGRPGGKGAFNGEWRQHALRPLHAAPHNVAARQGTSREQVLPSCTWLRV